MKLGVIGAGAWGTALAIAAARAGSDVMIWSRNAGVTDDINHNRLNVKYLKQVAIHPGIKATCEIEEALLCDAVLLVVPAQELRIICKNIKVKADVPLVICAKGVEQESLALMSDIVAEYFPNNPVAVLSGPNFAGEVAQGLPACATLACASKAAADKIIALLGGKLFRLYYSDDVVGAQIGGSVKNVIAIACGIAIGRGLGENARAALVTRGIAEMGRLCIKMGGRQETLLGLSGIGDIMLTCGSDKSRNMSLGIALGQGGELDRIIKNGSTVEGVATARSVAMLADKSGVDMPIVTAVKAILHDKASIDKTIEALMERPVAVDGGM